MRALALLLLAGCASMSALEAELQAAPAVKGGPWDAYVDIRGRRVDGDPPWEWTIRTSFRTLLHRPSGARLLLFAMHHLSSPDYFRDVELRLRTAHLVLDEGIDVSGRTKEDAREDVRAFHDLQVEICRTLGLQKQGDWEAGARDARWFAADLTLDETEHILKITRTTLSPGTLPAKREKLKAVDGVAQGQAFLLTAVASLGENEASAIDALQSLRDARAFAAVKARMAPGQTLAVVYGAAHARKLEPRFVAELGFELQSAEWLDVVDFRFDPKSADGLELRAWLRHREGDLAGARKDYDAALALDPRRPVALRGRAQLRLDLGDAQGALADFQAASEIEPRSVRPLCGIARALSALNRDAEAVAYLSRALEIDPQDTPALIQRGTARADAGDVAGGLEDLNLGLERLPGHPEALYARGVLHYRQKEPELAIRDLNAALEKMTHRPLPFLIRGHLHARAGRFREALQDYSEVLKLEAGNVDARYSRALVRIQLKDPDRALVDLNRLLELAPEHPGGRHARAKLHLDRDAWTEAVADCDVLLGKDPAHAQARHIRAKARWAKGDREGALLDYEALVPSGESPFESWMSIAKMRRAYGSAPEDLRRTLDKAAELRPSHPDLLMLRGDLAYDKGRWEEAEAAYRRVSPRTGTQQGRALLRLWMLAARRGEAASAEPALRAWLRGDPADTFGAWIAGLFLGEREEKAFLDAISSCDARFYAGSRRLFAGDVAGARALFALDHPPCGVGSHPASAAALRRLD